MERTHGSTGRATEQTQVAAGTVTGVTETDPNGNKLTYRFNGGRFLTDATRKIGTGHLSSLRP